MGENNVPISGDLIQEKALKFAAEKGIKDFFASGGWLSSFKAESYLGQKIISGEEGDVNTALVGQ